jgi:hypothetical protein
MLLIFCIEFLCHAIWSFMFFLNGDAFAKRVQNVISEAWSYQTNCCPDNEADGQQQSESQMQPPISANGISHAGIDTQVVQYAAPPQLGAGHAMVWTSHFNGRSLQFVFTKQSI